MKKFCIFQARNRQGLDLIEKKVVNVENYKILDWDPSCMKILGLLESDAPKRSPFIALYVANFDKANEESKEVLENCEILCFDDADKLLSQNFKGILDRFTSHLPETRQILLYLAAFPTVEHFMVRLETIGVTKFEFVHVRNPR